MVANRGYGRFGQPSRKSAVVVASKLNGVEMKKNTKTIHMQPVLLHVPAESDKVYTPPELAEDIVNYFQPSGSCIDPCAGSGVFFDLLPQGSEWCEIERGRDFYSWTKPMDWAVSNPPYTHYSAWLRHTMKIAKDIVYLIPVYKLFTSGKFLDDLFSWGGVVHIRRYGTGHQWGFPFGQAVAAVHYRAGYLGSTSWSRWKGTK